MTSDTPVAGKVKLTQRERSALAWLRDMHAKHPTNQAGFNPQPGAALRYLCMRRTLEPAGLVVINRLSPYHFRYGLTPAGRLALQEPSHVE